MPLLLPIHDLQPGMRLQDGVADRGRMLLPRGHVLTDGSIDSLRKRFAGRMVRIGDAQLDALVEFADDSLDREVAYTAQTRIADSVSKVHEQMSGRRDAQRLNTRSLVGAVQEVMEYLQEHPVTAAMVSTGMQGRDYLTEHTANVFYLSMTLGAAVRDYVAAERRKFTKAKELSAKIALNLTPLGVGSLLGDLSLVEHSELFELRTKLNAEEHRLLDEHPQRSADLLPDDVDATARLVVRSHHENCYGTGYPRALTAARIHVFARIVRIADAYHTGVACGPFGEPKSPTRVLWEMCRGPNRRYYDPVLLKIFRGLIQPIPIGAKIRLSDGRFGVVVRYNREDAFAPIIVIAFDAEGGRLPAAKVEGPITLNEHSPLRIKSFGDEDLSYLGRGDDGEGDQVIQSRFSTTYEAFLP